MPSFDVVSELDKHELTNAVDNAIKELDRRFDLKGKCSFEAKDKSVTLTAEADFMLEQMLDILRSNLVKRKVDSQCMEIKDAYPSGKVVKQDVNFREGIDKDLAKKIVGLIKERKLKVQAAIQGEQVRVTGKKGTGFGWSQDAMATKGMRWDRSTPPAAYGSNVAPSAEARRAEYFRRFLDETNAGEAPTALAFFEGLCEVEAGADS